MAVKSDLIAVMKRIGQVPSETLEDNIKMIEESKKTKAELEQVQESNATLTKIVEEMNSGDNDHSMYQEVLTTNERQSELLKAKDEMIAKVKAISK